MKYLYYLINTIFCLWIIWFFGSNNTFGQLSTIDNTSPSITQNVSQVFDTSSINNPLRQGSRFAIESPDQTSLINIINDNINWFDQAQNDTLWLIKNIINILLGFLSLIILIYLIYEGYLIVTAGTNEDQYKSAVGKLKNAAIAIAGIATSRFIVSFIFFVVNSIL